VMPCAPRWSSPCFSSATAAPAHSPLSLHDALPIFCRLTETEPIIVGKPAPHMMEFAAGRLGARRPLMVGDRLDTDIEGGRAAGFDTALVLTGIHDIHDALAAAPERRPTFILPSPRGLAAPIDGPDR